MSKMKCFFLTLALTLAVDASAFSDQLEPPRNPYLADSPWPMTHRNPYCQASTPLPGPRADDFNDQWANAFLASAEAVAITLNLSPRNLDGGYSIWGSARKSLFKLDANNGRWSNAQSIRKPRASKKAISGAYTLLDRDGRLFVPSGQKILVYTESTPGRPQSSIDRRGNIELPYELLQSDDEMIVGINLTYDGYLVVVTTHALLAVFSRDGELKSSIRLSPHEQVSNSIALDEDGGIYVVTHKKIYRVDWGKGELAIKWASEYPSSEQVLPGRLGLGSGTTPTLMGFGAQDKLVLIADGQKAMNIIAFWRDQIPENWQSPHGFSQRVAGVTPITFGKSGVQRAITEQSLLVRGYDAVAVNNDYGDIPSDERSNFWTILYSNRKEYAPYGIEKFRWNPSKRNITSVWANPELSVPNGVPAMSSSTGLIYYVGQYRERWTVEGVDWETGALKFRHLLTDEIKFNSFYAGMEIGYSSDLITGVIGGALRIATRP